MAPERTTDVAVVGAGPAGAITALLLARHGLDVVLVDRAAFPRSKPCGDCLSAGATGLLHRLGLLDRVRAAGATDLHHWAIITRAGTRATGRLDGAVALSLDRRRLDATLLDAAREAGASFLRGHVTDLDRRDGRTAGIHYREPDGSERSLQARLVVGADGLRSVVARRLGRLRRGPRIHKVSLTAHLRHSEGPRHGEMHLIPDGCVGYAPAGAGLCNLTLVLTTDAAAALRRTGPAAFFLRHVRDARWLSIPPRTVAHLEALDDDELLASGPFDFPGRSPVTRGAALVGDAAGYYDPFTGQGIHHAMAAAERLADTISPALVRNAPPRELDRALRDYARAKRRMTRRVRRVQHGVEWVLSRPGVAEPVLARLASAPLAMDRLVEVTGDLRGPASLLSPAVVSSLMFPEDRRPQ